MNILEHEQALESSGFKREQARAILDAIASGDEAAFTKRDGRILETALRGDMEKIEAKMEKMETRLDAKIDNTLLSLKLHMWMVLGAGLTALVAFNRLGVLQ